MSVEILSVRPRASAFTPREGRFELVSKFAPQGDQPKAIEQLVEGLEAGLRFQTLVGVTGSGKTFTMANVIERVNLPTLIISHNKVLAAQLYSEFRQFFPKNAVEYFVSYYDYYQPEAYVPSTDTYIEKETDVNDEIERLRLSATTSLIERRDTIVVASVSSIYGLGAPTEYLETYLPITLGGFSDRGAILRKLVSLQYTRKEIDFHRGTFRVKGDVIDIFPGYGLLPIRVELFGDEVERISEFDPLTGKVFRELESVTIWPAKHYVTGLSRLRAAIASIREELDDRVAELTAANKLIEAQRIQMRTRFDLEMLRETGVCQGIENYSRHLDGRAPGERPFCLLDYFPNDYLVIVDESHIMLPQIHGMYGGDRSRKETLVEYGFRLPSALDNRPLRFEEFIELVERAIFVSATPAEWERAQSGQVVEQIIRPTGLVDPEVEVRPARGQVDDLIARVREAVEAGGRVLATTLTRKMAEDLATFLQRLQIKAHYLHFQIDTVERVDILERLRRGEIDVVVGVNLLREGLDLPEVKLVAVLDSDKEGFLRSETSLIQICGRAARNVEGRVILYADEITGSMERALAEMKRRRELQQHHNREHGIQPKTVEKALINMLEDVRRKKTDAREMVYRVFDEFENKRVPLKDQIARLKARMVAAAKELDFEEAALYRDRIKELEKQLHARKGS
ncbi:MAG: UvrABC system protein B [bacterium]|nr:UvrABC system protein B [bacterium]